MNVQKTLEFVLAQQAKAAEQQYRTDRRIDAITKLIRTGMQMLANNQSSIKALIASQERHEERLAVLEERQVAVDERLLVLDERQAAVEERLAAVDERLARSEERIEKLLQEFLRRRKNGR